LKARVAVSFEESGDGEKKERTSAVRDKLIEQVFHRCLVVVKVPPS
jgi:hypothetical protein